MQNWKIKRMSYKRIHAWIVAINKLLAYYEGKVKEYPECPLCEVVDPCKRCLWKLIENKTCSNFRAEKFSYYDYGRWETLKKSKRWRALRIPMLKNWKKILKLELARREE